MTERTGDTLLSVLVLCTGNVGRSPLAEVMLRRALATELGVTELELPERGVTVASAGTHAPEGHAAANQAVALAAARGLDLSQHRAHRLTRRELARADLILCMDNQQMAAVAEMLPEAVPRAELIADEEIPDPREESEEFFRSVAERIESAVRQRIPALVVRIEYGNGTGSRWLPT